MSYPLHQLAKALAAGDDIRLARWRAVLRGMASGTLKIGSRTPVKGLPAWVTPEVVRGGFATGKPAAAPGDADLFVRSLEGGLDPLLDSGAYAVVLPEHAALLVVAWLQRAGDVDAAERLVREIAPFAGRLRFAPLAAEPLSVPREIVWRQTAADSRAGLEAKRPQPRVLAMNATLSVWNPYADALLAHWLDEGSDGWHERGRGLLARYDELARAHVPPRRHTSPKENAAILRLALTDPEQRARVPHVLETMRAARGDQHAALRAEQARVAARPLHRDLARAVAARLGERPLDDAEPFLRPVDGTPVPRSIRRVVERALAAPAGELIERGVIPSAEVLAELVPRIAAATVHSGAGARCC